MDLNEVGGSAAEAVIGDDHAPVITVQCVEGLGNKFESPARSNMRSNIETAGKAEIGGGVVRSKAGVATAAGEAVVGVVSVLAGIAEDSSVDRTAAADGEDSGNLRIVEELREHGVVTAEGLGLVDSGEDEAVALVGDAGSALAGWGE